MLGILMLLTVAAPQAQDFSWTGQIGADQRVAVRNIIGEVRIERASGRTIEVVAQKRAGRYGDPADVTITAEESSRGITFCVRYPGSNSSRDRDEDGKCQSGGNNDGRRNRNDTEVNFTIRLPEGVRLDAGTVAGSVVANGLGADASVSSVSGNVTVEGFRGDRLDATTVSGSVSLSGVRARRVEASTVSGNVTFEGTLARDGDYDLTTLSGRVLVDLPSGSGAEVRASTFSGRLRMPEGVTSSSERRRNRVSGRIGGGGASLNVESFSGSVEVRVGNR